MSAKAKRSTKILDIKPDQELDVLRKILEITNSELELQMVLKEVVKIVNEIVAAESVFIYLFDARRKNLILQASKTPHKKELGNVILKIGEGITGWVAEKDQEVTIFEKAYEDKRFKTFDVLPEDRYEAFLSLPINAKNKPIGVINIQHRKPHQYSENSITLLKLIAKQISGVITNAKLYERNKQKAVQFDSLMKVSETINSENYLDEILNLITVVTAEMINSKICSIMLLDKKGNHFITKANFSLSEEYKNKPHVKVKGSLLGEVIKTKQVMVISDVKEEKKYQLRDLAVKEDLSSMICIPMNVRDNVIGVLTVYTKQPYVFSKDDRQILQMVGNQAAVAVENTKLVEEALKAKEALETRKVVERAKGILMRVKNLDEQTAYKVIHKKSMDSCKSMKEVAESILLLDDF